MDKKANLNLRFFGLAGFGGGALIVLGRIALEFGLNTIYNIIMLCIPFFFIYVWWLCETKKKLIYSDRKDRKYSWIDFFVGREKD